MERELRRAGRPSRSPGLVTAAGVLVMVVAGVAASRYAPSWFDPDEGCRFLGGRCVTEATEARRSALNQVQWAGFAVVLLGLALTCRRLPAARPSAPVFPLPAWGHAAAAGLLGMALTAVLAPVALIAVLVATDAAPAFLCLVWLLQSRALVALDRLVGTDRPKWGWLTGLVAAAAGVAATVWLTVEMLGPRSLLLPSVANGAVLAAVVLAGRVLPVRGEGPDTPPLRVGAAAGLAGLAVVSAAVLTFAGTRPPEPPAPTALGPQPTPAPLPPSEREPDGPHGDAEADAPSVPAPPVDADVACAPGDLAWSTAGWDAAMGIRAVTVIATNQGSHPCYVDGFADVALVQGGRPLQLVTAPGSPADPSAAVAARRVGIAPGGTAYFALSWKGSGAAADQDIPQSLTVSIPGAAASEVPLSRGPAPFDVVDGATLLVGPWLAG